MNRKIIQICIFTVCWYWSSGINAVASQKLFITFFDSASLSEEYTRSPFPLALMLTSMQLSLGGFLSMTYRYLAGKLDLNDIYNQRTLVVGLLHLTGHWCTNMGFGYGSASLVQIIKLLEPIETLLLAALANKISNRGSGNQVFTTRKVLSTLVIIGGTCMLLGQKSMNANLHSIAFALCSGFCMASRNVLTKSANSDVEEVTLKHGTYDVFQRGMDHFSQISILSAIPSAAVLFSTTITNPTRMSSFVSEMPRQTLFQAVGFHVLYNIASITVLSLSSAPLHSLLNVGKRISNVLIALLTFRDPLSPSGTFGLLFAACGAFIYSDNNVLLLLFLKACKKCTRGLVIVILFTCLCTMKFFRITDDTFTKKVSVISKSHVPLIHYVDIDNQLNVGDAGLLATMPIAGMCKETYVFNDPVDLLPRTSPTTLGGNLICFQNGGLVGAVVYMDSILSYSDFDVFQNWTRSIDLFSGVNYRVIDRKDIIMHGRYLPSNRENNAARKGDGNKGNFVWSYGATNLLNPYTTRFVSMKNLRTAAFVVASANFLYIPKDENDTNVNNGFGHANKLANAVVKNDLPTIVLGVGVQIRFDQIQNLSSQSFIGLDPYMKFLTEVGNRHDRKSISVRGDVTETFCRNSGISQCISLGCPSLTISHNLNLGGILKAKLAAVSSRLANRGHGKNLKVVFALPALNLSTPSDKQKYKAILSLFLQFYQQHDCYFIMQAGYDRLHLNTHSNIVVNHTRILEFEDSVEPWFEFMRTVDLVVSTRIHGGMAGVVSEVPTIIIPTDYRIYELVNSMKLPFLDVDQILRKNYTSLLEMLDDVSFDFESFERNRKMKIAEYQRILHGVGLQIHPKLENVITAYAH